jgi:RNA polymerase sigma factor (TIGR02999 family)
MTAHDGSVTGLLAAMHAGRGDAAELLLPIVYRELRGIAAAQMARERGAHTLTPTALVHEAWLRLASGPQPDYTDRRHFIAIAAIAMRRVLVDHARGVLRDKRGGGLQPVTLVTGLAQDGSDPAGLIALDAALDRLAAHDATMARVVELRWFGGLSVEEAAEVLETSPRSVNRGWTAARAWLARELAGG